MVPSEQNKRTQATLENLAVILAVGAGLAAHAYAAGGIVDHVRFAHAHLRATQVLSLVSGRQARADCVHP